MIKEIPGYEGFYGCCKHGKIFRFPYINSLGLKTKLREIHPTVLKDGYYVYALHKNNKRKNILGHRLVAFTFLPTPEHDQIFVNHKNFITNDNRPENLEWVTKIESARYKRQSQNRKKEKFEKLPMGITYKKNKKSYQARYGQKNLGQRKSVEEAIELRRNFMKKMFGDRYEILTN